MDDISNTYAYLPEDLLGKILENVPNTVQKMNGMFDIQEEPMKKGIDKLRNKGLTKILTANDFSESLIAVDGGVIIEKMTGSDLLLAVAAGVEGLAEDKKIEWGKDNNQFYQWQTVLPHGEANSRLAQGIMFLMELSVLANAKHEIRIMDGTHFTSIIKINGMLSAIEDNAGEEYTNTLKAFLKDTYAKVIPDIPDIVEAGFNNDAIVALVKYSSSKDVNDAFLKDFKITVDDKTFFSLALSENEYLVPLPVGQSIEEREGIWDQLHISCNLKIPERDDLNLALAKAINPLRTTDIFTKQKKESDLYFSYYKPFNEGPAYRLEIKKSLAKDTSRFEKVLSSIKRQIIYPEIIEPYPQYLVDLMVKSISTGMFAIKEAIRISPDLKLENSKFNLLFGYRTK